MEIYIENGEWEIEYIKLIRVEWSFENYLNDVYFEVYVCSMEVSLYVYCIK